CEGIGGGVWVLWIASKEEKSTEKGLTISAFGISGLTRPWSSTFLTSLVFWSAFGLLYSLLSSDSRSAERGSAPTRSVGCGRNVSLAYRSWKSGSICWG